MVWVVDTLVNRLFARLLGFVTLRVLILSQWFSFARDTNTVTVANGML
jgi:hypothetical protein